MIILRRPVDRKLIEKFLEGKGYRNEGRSRREKSNVLCVHLTGRSKGWVTYNGQCYFNDKVGVGSDAGGGTKHAIEHACAFARSMFGHENLKVIKTKPSVKKAIIEIEKYI